MTNLENSPTRLTRPRRPGAYFDTDATAVVVEHLTITDKDVVREAQRWTTGERGPIIEDPALLGGADLTAYVTEAIRMAHSPSLPPGRRRRARRWSGWSRRSARRPPSRPRRPSPRPVE